MKLRKSDINHLRRLLGYVRCEIGQSPEEVITTVRSIVEKIGEPNSEGKARLIESHRKAQAIPKYVRAAVKALEKRLVEKGDILEGEIEPRKNVPATVKQSTKNRGISRGTGSRTRP